MTSPPRRWARAERLDAARTFDALRARTGVRLTFDGPCPGGQIGTAYVRWPDQRRSVLKWRPHSRAADLEAGPLTVSRVLRQAGCPAPATELVAQVDHAVVMVQELLPGTKVDHLDHDVLVQALGGVLSIMPGSRGPAPHLPALSSLADAPRRLPPPPCDARHRTPLPDPA